MKVELLNHLTWLTNKLSEGNTYSWSDEIKAIESKEAFETFYKSIENNNLIDLENITAEEARELRFQKWDDDSNLYLFPLWIAPLIPEGMEITCIDGSKTKYSKEDTDKDVRFGCLAYGIIIDEKEDK